MYLLVKLSKKHTRNINCRVQSNHLCICFDRPFLFFLLNAYKAFAYFVPSVIAVTLVPLQSKVMDLLADRNNEKSEIASFFGESSLVRSAEDDTLDSNIFSVKVSLHFCSKSERHMPSVTKHYK